MKQNNWVSFFKKRQFFDTAATAYKDAKVFIRISFRSLQIKRFLVVLLRLGIQA